MNRERLTILRDHLDSLPDEKFDMRWIVAKVDGFGDMDDDVDVDVSDLGGCGTVACIAGWVGAIFWRDPNPDAHFDSDVAGPLLSLSKEQEINLFMPMGYQRRRYTRTDAIAAIQSMLDSPDDDALPVWPSRDEVAA